MNILITGASGQVGWELVQRAERIGAQVHAFNSTQLDITDAAAVQAAVKSSGVDVVINAAAYTAVDRAESESARAFAVNRDGAEHLASACSRAAIPLLHISTDYVFDGQRSQPYAEDAVTAPQSVYGLSKWQGEERVRERLAQHIILRISWVFGREGQNFVKTMLRLARERQQLTVVADQRGCPSYAGSVADCLLTIAQRVAFSSDSVWGTYHYAGVPVTTWHEFAETIVALARSYEALAVEEVLPITTADYPTPAVRPKNSVLVSQRLEETFGIMPHSWREGLIEMLRYHYGQSSC